MLAVLDRVRGRAVGLLADEDAVDRRGRLDPGGGVEHVAPGDALALLGALAVRDDHLAGRDPDPNLDLADRILGVERARPSSRIVERGADRALGVVLVRDRHAEVRDDRVADVLLDRAAVALELGAEAAVVELEQREHVLRVELLRERGRADEVDEDERVELALLVRRPAAARRAASASGEPQFRQKRARSGFSSPQFAQSGMP